MLNAFQRSCAAAYGEGDFAHVESLADASAVQDTLFSFLMIELSSEEGCANLTDAVRRLEMAQWNI